MAEAFQELNRRDARRPVRVLAPQPREVWLAPGPALREQIGDLLAEQRGDAVLTVGETPGEPLAPDEVAAALAAVVALLEGWTVTVLCEREDGVDCLVRRPLPEDDFVEVRVATVGAVDAGKCLREDTPVMMADGTVRPIQELSVGEKIMGDDSQPRTILETTTGVAELFKITPVNGDAMTVTRNHILCLKAAHEVVEMTLGEYMQLQPHVASDLKLYRVPVLLKNKRRSPKDNLVTGIKCIESDGIQPYYGFEIDGNGRFLLGDFTVTHNSSFLGVLTTGELDNGRGKARLKIARHHHEAASGRTSSVTHTIFGVDTANAVVNRPNHAGVIDWRQICADAAKVISLADLAGHEKYLKTTTFGMTGHAPDFVMMFVAANSDASRATHRMTKEHIKLALGLGVPIVVGITKTDMAPPEVRARTTKYIKGLLKAPGCRKTPLMMQSPADLLAAYEGVHSGQVAPIFEISNVTGDGHPLLRTFMGMLSSRRTGDDAAPTVYQVDDDFSVPGIGTVVSGMVLAGKVRVGDVLMLGPDRVGDFAPAQVKSIERQRMPVAEVRSQEMATLALKKIPRDAVRRGMVLAAKAADVAAAWQIEAYVVVLHHPSTITRGYQAMVHCGTVKQTARIIDIRRSRRGDDDDEPTHQLRSGDDGVVRLAFVRQPEWLPADTRLVLREGMSKAVGRVLAIDCAAPAFDRRKYRRPRAPRDGDGDGTSRRERRRRRKAREPALEAAMAGAQIAE